MVDGTSDDDWEALAEAALAAARNAGTDEERRHQLERAAIYAELAEHARWPRSNVPPTSD
jgi:hypothetical protein